VELRFADACLKSWELSLRLVLVDIP